MDCAEDTVSRVTSPILRLITLGQLALQGDTGENQLVGQRRKLALLCVLALAESPVTRNSLVAMFWRHENDERARHSLSNALSALRGVLGPDAFTSHRATVALRPTAVQTDVRELLEAAGSRDHARVLALHNGTFLEGADVGQSMSFLAWERKIRVEVDRTFVLACAAQALIAARSRDWISCATTSRRWLAVAPTSPDAALHLLNAIRAGHSPAARRAALEEYDRLVERLASDFNTTPDERVVSFAARIRVRVDADRNSASVDTSEFEFEWEPDDDAVELSAAAANDGRPGGEPEQGMTRTVREPVDLAQSLSPQRTPVVRPHRRFLSVHSRSVAIAATALVVSAIVGLVAARWYSHAARITRPVIAITDIANVHGDTALVWLQDGLMQMLATGLSRSSDLDVIEPRRVTEIRDQTTRSADGILSSAEAVRVARRLKATLLLRGELSVGHNLYLLSVTLLDATTGRTIRAFNVTDSDPVRLTDRVAGRVRDASAATDTARPRLSDLETPSVAAYGHFMRAQQAQAEGRGAESARELDAAIALDSGFAAAVAARLSWALDNGNDAATVAHLRRMFASSRITDWDVLKQAIDSATHNGENQRAALLATSLVQRYPRDPRAYETLAGLLGQRGQFVDAVRVYKRELALDSLGNEAGAGPCVPCTAYASLIWVEAAQGHLSEAEWTVQQWLRLQPNAAGAWDRLATVLSFEGRHGDAAEAERRASVLSGNDFKYAASAARLLIMARRFDAADSMVASWRHGDAAHREDAADITALVQRERGQLRASIRTLEAAHLLVFEEMDGMARLRNYAGAARLFATRVGGPEAKSAAAQHDLVGDEARSFAWGRAIEAEAIAGSGDTVSLHALADSIRNACVRSYYGRDWRLYHHLLGRIAMQGHRYSEAEREFNAARWGVAGWTVSVVWMARAQMAENHPTDAIATLRDAYRGPLDASGRYEPRSELDFLMATAFAAAKMTDSAAVYADYTRTAWKNADPEVKRQLATL